jgi:uncharacterized membrane protein (UPF0127 family)
MLAAALLAGAACTDSGAEEATPPSSTAATATAPCEDPALRPLEGFGDAVLRVTDPDGNEADHCVLVAATPEARAQGLMEQQDLRGYAGMVFRFTEPSLSAFFMRNTRIPLDVVFYGLNGTFISSEEMAPCPDDVADCPTYGSPEPYLTAIELAAGDAEDLGLAPGSRIAFP